MLTKSFFGKLSEGRLIVYTVDDDLFGQEEYQPKLEWNNFSARYVGDMINVDEFAKWSPCTCLRYFGANTI